MSGDNTRTEQDMWYFTLYGGWKSSQTSTRRIRTKARLLTAVSQAMAAQQDFSVSRYPVS